MRIAPVPARLALLLLVLQASRADGPSKEVRARLAAVGKTHGIELVASRPSFPVATRHGEIGGRAADTRALEEYVPLFADELTLYPAALIARSRLKSIVLCEELSFAGQRRNAVPDFEHDVLYLDASRGRHDRSYQRKVIHHEFFHVVDLRDDRQLYADAAWTALNPAGFTYGTGGKNAQGQSDTSVLTDRFPGFLNHYSTTGVEEDKAEMFANLIVDPVHVEERATTDAVIRAKAQRMRELLAAFCPDVDAKFWERVRARQVAEKPARSGR